MFDLDLRSRDPIYQQLVNKFKELIINDVLKHDEKLPSVRALAQQLTINPNTIQKAYRELEAQGYIYSVKGKGSFVDASAYKQEHKLALQKIKSDLEKLLREAFYLGMDKEELIKMAECIYEQTRGGSKS